MEEYKTIEGQNIFDLSNLLYGNTSNLIKLLTDNPALGYVVKNIPAGTVVKYTKQKGNNITNFYISESVKPGTKDITAPLQGNGFTSGFEITGFN